MIFQRNMHNTSPRACRRKEACCRFGVRFLLWGEVLSISPSNTSTFTLRTPSVLLASRHGESWEDEDGDLAGLGHGVLAAHSAAGSGIEHRCTQTRKSHTFCQ